jgi:simple sugar transport system ATP-binding protein
MSDTGPSAPVVAVRLSGITKRFGALLASDDVSLELRRGEVLALLGENGAGKSTLVSILFGHYVADAGTIEVDGRPLPPGRPKAALAAGIGLVHQHFTLADNLSVLDNVMLGTEPLWQPFSRRYQARARLLDAAARFGLQVDPQARVGALSVGERQRVEILKALVRGARYLILDEPTAVLTPQESRALFATLKKMVAEGMAIVFISHKLDEVRAVSGRIAVLRAGKLVARFDDGDAVAPQELAQAMVGRTVEPVLRGARRAPAPARIVCALRAAGVARRADRPPLADLNLELHAGEVVAIAGVAGNGQRTLADLLSGLVPLSAGTLEIGGRALPPDPRAFVRAGVARVPEDRQSVGAIGDLSVWENALLDRYASRRFARWGWLRSARAREHARTIVERFDVRGAGALGLDAPARALSGGNLQKLILGRALSGAHYRESAAAADRGAPADLGARRGRGGGGAPAAAGGLRGRRRRADDQRRPRRDPRAGRPHRGDARGPRHRGARTRRVERGATRHGDGRRRGGRQARRARCSLSRARTRRPGCGWPRRPRRCCSRWRPRRCWWPGPARRWARPTRCCSRAASARASRGPRR